MSVSNFEETKRRNTKKKTFINFRIAVQTIKYIAIYEILFAKGDTVTVSCHVKQSKQMDRINSKSIYAEKISKKKHFEIEI